MTMPNLMNCPHQGEGWCLDCVGKLHTRAESLQVQRDGLLSYAAELRATLEAIETSVEPDVIINTHPIGNGPHLYRSSPCDSWTLIDVSFESEPPEGEWISQGQLAYAVAKDSFGFSQVLRVEGLLSAVKEHHDETGDNRCHLDDDRLYAKALGIGRDPYDSALPPEKDMAESCRRYIAQRQHPETAGTRPLPGCMTIAQLTEEVTRLRTELAAENTSHGPIVWSGKAPRVAWDIGGVLSKFPDICKKMILALNKGGVENYIITDMHDPADIDDLLSRNGIYNYIHPNRVYSAEYDAYGEACKAVLIARLNIDILIDDFGGYMAWPWSNPGPLRLITAPDPYRPYNDPSWKTDETKPAFGRNVFYDYNAGSKSPVSLAERLAQKGGTP